MSQDTRDGLMEELDAALRTAPQAYEIEPTPIHPEELMRDRVARRLFLQRAGLAGLGMAAVSLLNGCNGNDDNNGGPSTGNTATPGPTANGTAGATAGPTAAPTATPRPGVDQRNFPGILGNNINAVVLNFVLAHEYGEVDLYRQALNIVSGLAITTPLSTTQNYRLAVPAGPLNPASGQVPEDGVLFLRNQAFVETAHRDFLIAQVQRMGSPVQPPNPAGYKFAFGAPRTLSGALSAILMVEQNGQRGGLGAAPFLTTLEMIQTASQLHSVECRHQAAIQHTLGQNPGPYRTPGDLLVTPNYPSPDTFEYYRTPPVTIAKDQPYKRPGTAADNVTGPRSTGGGSTNSA